MSCTKVERNSLNFELNLLIRSWVFAGLVGVLSLLVVVGAVPPAISLLKTMSPAVMLPKTAATSVPSAALSVGIPRVAHALTDVRTGMRKAASIRKACCVFESPDIFLTPKCVIGVCSDMLKSIH